MNLGFTQIILILLVGFLLFGNFPAKVQELAKGFKTLKKEFSNENNKDQEKH